MIALPQHSIDRASHELQDRVALFLQQRQVTLGGRVVVEAHRGVVTISGQLPTYYQRQLVHTFTRRVAGVVQVIDQIEVVGPPSPAVRHAVRAEHALVPA
jgi:osmotically-inducible protein OsmY